jgi:LPXTG-site transpeptidase (sortase) family protein
MPAATAGPAARVPVPAALPRAPRRERHRRTIPWKRWGVRAVVVVVGLFLLHLFYAEVVTGLVHDQRQQHLAAELQEPAAAVGDGDAVAVLQVPDLLLNEVVVEGVDVDHLRSGPARLSGSALPGDAGIVVVYGHRDAYAGPFEKISTLVNGQQVVLQARNNGPIVKYIVDRVERDVDVADVVVEQTDLVSYLFLVTSEPGTFADGQTVVVARALPVTDTAPVVPRLADVGAGAVPFGIEALLALGSLVIAVLVVQHLRARASQTVLLAVATPVALYAVLRLVMLADTVLPLTR